MATVCGLATTLRAGQVFTSPFRQQLRRIMKPPDASIVFVVDDDADVRASIQGLLKSVGLRSQCFRTTQEFLHNEGRTNPLDSSKSALSRPINPNRFYQLRRFPGAEKLARLANFQFYIC
jgi:hypothetical protein